MHAPHRTEQPGSVGSANVPTRGDGAGEPPWRQFRESKGERRGGRESPRPAPQPPQGAEGGGVGDRRRHRSAPGSPHSSLRPRGAEGEVPSPGPRGVRGGQRDSLERREPGDEDIVVAHQRHERGGRGQVTKEQTISQEGVASHATMNGETVLITNKRELRKRQHRKTRREERQRSRLPTSSIVHIKP